MSLENCMPAWVKRIGLGTVVVLFVAGIAYLILSKVMNR